MQLGRWGSVINLITVLLKPAKANHWHFARPTAGVSTVVMFGTAPKPYMGTS